MPLHQTSIDKTFLLSGPRKYPSGQLIKISTLVFSSPHCWLTSYCGKMVVLLRQKLSKPSINGELVVAEPNFCDPVLELTLTKVCDMGPVAVADLV